MSAPINDGGPAFPVAMNEISGAYCGMTLRDWFAGQALAGALQNYTKSKFGCTETEVAVGAYRYADAMIAVREQKEESK